MLVKKSRFSESTILTLMPRKFDPNAFVLGARRQEVETVASITIADSATGRAVECCLTKEDALALRHALADVFDA